MDVVGCDMYTFKSQGIHSGPSLLILNDQGGGVMDVSEEVTATLRAQEHGHQPIICLAFDAYNMADTGKVAKTLNSAATDTDHIPVICLQANCIDRADTARENGCGWSEEGVSYTLNIIDRHAICYEEHTQGKVATMSHDLFSTRFGEDGKANTLAATDYKEPPIVCYAVDQQGGKGGANWLKDKMCTLCSDSHGTPHAVCYAVDCRNLYLNTEISGTLQAKNEGGHSLNFLNPILLDETI